jgi:hypothetical protein
MTLFFLFIMAGKRILNEYFEEGYWGLNSGPTARVTPPALFCDGFLR